MSIKFSTNIILIALLTVLLQQMAMAETNGLTAKINHLLAEKFQANNTGAVFLVAKDGVPIYRKAFGQANLELGVNMKPENVFQIGSMTKQFTAVSILMLQEQGKLDVNDKLAKFIPDYPNGENITLHHLLTHTSGIKDYTKMKSLWSVAKKDYSPKELVDFFKNEPADFGPGEQFKYNNSGYGLLGYIIELVADESYEDFVEKYIFKSLGMQDSRYADDSEIINNRAYGYHNRGQFTNRMMVSLTIPYAAGALMSTVDDMLKWQQAIKSNKLLKKSTLKQALTPNKLNNGEPFTYGYGWHLKDLAGVATREHGGSIFGFKSMSVYMPSVDVYVIGLTNCDCISPTKITRDIAALFIN